MTTLTPNRRALIIGLAALVPATAIPAVAQGAPLMQVLKDPDCGCCGDWIDIMRNEGFQLEVRDISWEALSRFKAQNGISEGMASCHTAEIDGYMIEGHVPAGDIRRLLSERPEAVGLSVPGMPYGAPGMGPEAERDTYSVHLIRKDGSTEVFAHYEGA
jgi:hypothetical protein